jgi:hypothetical protein
VRICGNATYILAVLTAEHSHSLGLFVQVRICGNATYILAVLTREDSPSLGNNTHFENHAATSVLNICAMWHVEDLIATLQKLK